MMVAQPTSISTLRSRENLSQVEGQTTCMTTGDRAIR